MTVSLFAVVGADLNLGPKDDMPRFASMAAYQQCLGFLEAITRNQVMVVGSRTMKIMEHYGYQLSRTAETVVPWSRSYGVSPEEFLAQLEAENNGRNIYICGGEKTFEIFAPFCEAFYIRRAAMVTPPDHRLPPIMPGWTRSIRDATKTEAVRMA